jgi:hypothetical protein
MVAAGEWDRGYLEAGNNLAVNPLDFGGKHKGDKAGLGQACRAACEDHAACRGYTYNPPTPRTKWTRRVPHPVLIGHAASLSQVQPGAGRVLSQDRRVARARRVVHARLLVLGPRDRPPAQDVALAQGRAARPRAPGTRAPHVQLRPNHVQLRPKALRAGCRGSWVGGGRARPGGDARSRAGRGGACRRRTRRWGPGRRFARGRLRRSVAAPKPPPLPY